MTDYGFMPATPCAWCNGRWPTRYQFVISVMGPDGNVAVPLCSQCWHRLVDSSQSRAFMRTFVGAVRRTEEGGCRHASPPHS